jgi:hypothetical protein
MKLGLPICGNILLTKGEYTGFGHYNFDARNAPYGGYCSWIGNHFGNLYGPLRDIEFNLRTKLTILPVGSKNGNMRMEVPTHRRFPMLSFVRVTCQSF